MKASQLMFTSSFNRQPSVFTIPPLLPSWPYYSHMSHNPSHSLSFAVPTTHHQYSLSKESSPFSHEPSAFSSNQFMGLDISHLAHFCADMVCSIWHFNSGLLEKPADPAFHSFCYHVLSTSQVSVPVILLTLIYIQRFKTSSPCMKGADSSEGRLLTVALMLANKYLDDNPFTNRTWSEVTGIPLQEINIMEREFLAILLFDLNVSYRELKGWSKSLIDHLEYQDTLLRSALSTESSITPTYNYSYGESLYWSYWHPFVANIHQSHYFPNLSLCKYTFPFAYCQMFV